MNRDAPNFKHLGDLLVEKGYLRPDCLQAALECQRREGRSRLLGEILVDQGDCTEGEIVECLASQYGLPYVNPDARLMDPRLADILPRDYLEKNLVLPLFLVRGVLTVAVAEPSNLFLLDEIRALTKAEVQIAVASPRDLQRAIAAMPEANVFVLDDVGLDGKTERESAEEAVDPREWTAASIAAGQPPINGLVNQLIHDAVTEGASDIHIEPAERSMRVRYRIDGRLRQATETPPHLLEAVANRIKSMSAMNAGNRAAREGQIQVMLDGRKIDLRVHTFPSAHGERIVIRVFDAAAVSLNIEDLGFAEDVLDAFRAEILAPSGIVLVAGPAGSGKSTTLYSAINAIATSENNVCTVEDTIEYRLPLASQFPVASKQGMTFSKTLQAVLRQDPDVVMVGDIGDRDTAFATVQASLAGHLLFAAMQANDACSAIARLVHLGVEPCLVGAALNAVLAQRLVRRVCAKCRVPYDPPREIRKTLEPLGYDLPKLYRGKGCPFCNGTGFRGRIGVHELLVLNDEMRDAVAADSTLGNLRNTAAAAGLISLARDGFRKVREGITTVEEVLHVIGGNVRQGRAWRRDVARQWGS